MLAENRAKLAEMEKQLSTRNDQIGKLSALIKHLNNELDEREATIAKLEEVIKDQKSTIRELAAVVDASKVTISEMEEENVRQREMLSQQENSSNSVYFTFGSSKQLKERGLLKGGFMKKKKVDFSAIDKSNFTQADKRQLSEIAIPSGDARVLSGQPENSYKIEEIDRNKCKVVITDKERFWNVSNVLIIQMK